METYVCKKACARMFTGDLFLIVLCCAVSNRVPPKPQNVILFGRRVSVCEIS